MLPAIPREQQLGILRTMLMIRRAEEHCIRFHAEHEGLIRGYEYELTLLAVAVSIMLMGAGPASLDKNVLHRDF